MPSYYITTLGCPKNQADSRAMQRSLRRVGLQQASSSAQSDIHLINSCSFIESARAETIQTVLEAAEVRKESNQKIVLVGCFSERYQQAVVEELPEVDFCFGTGHYANAGTLIRDHFALDGGQDAPAIHIVQDAVAAPVKISDGCDRGCAFCAIPLFRGPFNSTPAREIIKECKKLAAEGVREICLVSQDTNRYGGSVDALIQLLVEIEEIPEIHWIRLLYLYPDARTGQIFTKIQQHQLHKVVPYLESPIQHASAGVLRAMRRYGDLNTFINFFNEMRTLVPELEIRTSFLIGYPAETEADILQLEKFLNEVRPEKLALFAYSLEEGTPGFKQGDTVSTAVKARRINSLRELHLKILGDAHRSRVGRVYKCMIDRIDPDGTLVARRPQDAPGVDEQVCLAPGDWPQGVQPGDLLDIEIVGFYEYDMTGRSAAGAVREKI